MFLLHLSYIHRHFPNKFSCLHLLTSSFPNKNPCPHLPIEARDVTSRRATLAARRGGEAEKVAESYRRAQMSALVAAGMPCHAYAYAA